MDLLGVVVTRHDIKRRMANQFVCFRLQQNCHFICLLNLVLVIYHVGSKKLVLSSSLNVNLGRVSHLEIPVFPASYWTENIYVLPNSLL